MQKTKIEYLDYTWNPIAMKCTPVTEGCKNCWHLRMANRLASNPQISEGKQRAYGGGDIHLTFKEMDEPGKIKTPSKIGVQFMGDLFHENVPASIIFAVFMTMAKTRNLGHKFILLTKRPNRMHDLIKRWTDEGVTFHEGYTGRIPNFIHLGVSISTNDDLWMVDKLLEIPAAVRFVSYEPALEWVNMGSRLRAIDWLIMGAETGNGKRLFDLDWARAYSEGCNEFNTPFFFKQDGNGNNTIDGKIYQEYPK